MWQRAGYLDSCSRLGGAHQSEWRAHCTSTYQAKDWCLDSMSVLPGPSAVNNRSNVYPYCRIANQGSRPCVITASAVPALVLFGAAKVGGLAYYNFTGAV